jgi:hypothetical protein
MARKKLFDPQDSEPFRISRSKLELFMECPRCFYLDRRKGIGRPSGPPFTLNSAVDALLKREFDVHRSKKSAHPLMEAYGIDAVPYAHDKLDDWRMNFKGVEYLHKETNFLVFGAVDDIWLKPDGSLMVVDYKATSTSKEITLDDPWKQAYKRQMEIYQWLLRQNGFKVDNTGYFVFANGLSDKPAFNKKLEFAVTLVPYVGNAAWVEGKILAAHACLCDDQRPSSNLTCEYCQYVTAVKDSR